MPCGLKLCERSHQHEETANTKPVRCKQSPHSRHATVRDSFLLSSPRRLPVWLVDDLLPTPVPVGSLLFDVDLPPCTIWAVRSGLTSPENPPLTKVLSLLYCIYRRVNKITHLQPQETGAAQRWDGSATSPGHQAPGSCADHTRPGHILLLLWALDTGHQPQFTPGDLLCRGQESGNLGPALA